MPTVGLKAVGNKFPELVDGELPAELKEKVPRDKDSSARSVTSSASSAGVPASARACTDLRGILTAVV